MNKNSLQMTGQNVKQPKKQTKAKFREFQDRFQDDPGYIARGNDQENSSMGSPDKMKGKTAWETNSRASRGSKLYKGKR